jgi:hypothetical protein
VLAVLVLGVAAIAIWWITSRGEREKGTTDAAIADAATNLVDPLADAASIDSASAEATDGGPRPPSDGRTPATDAASRLATPDGGNRAPIDGGRAPAIDAGVRATGKLKVGAVPWGEVYLDGKKLPGQAPKTWDVPAGPHTIEIVFPATEDEPEIRKRFDIVVPEGGEESVSADFSR